MRSVSQGLINSVNAGGRAFVKAYVEYADGTNEWLTDNDFMQGSLSIQSGTSSSGSFDIGGAVIGSFAFNLNNWDLKFENRTFSGAIIVPYVGYEIKDFTLELVTELEEIFTTETGDNLVVELASQEGIEWVRLGTYYFVDHKSVGHVIRCDTYDAMKLFDENMLSDNNLNYPLAAWQVAQAIATHNGIPLATTRFPGSTIMLDAAPDNDMTERQALAYIGQMCGCYARINSEGRLAFEWYGDPEATISTRFDHDIDTEDINITGVRVTYGDEDETYLHGQEGYVLSISGNPWITENNYAEVAANVAQNVVGMTFRPGSMNVLSTPQYESGDVVRAYDDKGVQIVFLITNLTFTFSLRESLSCDAETRDQRDLRSSVSSVFAERVKAYARGELTAYDMQYMELSRLMSMSMGMFETREYDDTGGFVLYLHNKPNLSESDTVWKKTADAFAVSTNYNTPNPTWNAGITSEGKALVNILSAVGINADWVSTGILADRNGGYNQWNLDTGELRLNAGTKVGTGHDTLNTMLTNINANAQGLSVEITNRRNAVTAEENRAVGVENSLSARITANAEGLTTKVESSDYNGQTIASLINQSASSVTINANKINFVLGQANNKGGKISVQNASNVEIGSWDNSGIKAIAGNLAGWVLGSNTSGAYLYHDNVYDRTSETGSIQQQVYFGNPNAPTSGSLAIVVRHRTWTSGSATSWSNKFNVTYGGKLQAYGGGQIGAWALGEGNTGALSNGMTSLSDTTHNGVWIGSDGIALGKGNFKVTNAGAITAVGGGKIGTWTLGTGTNGALYNTRNALRTNKNGIYLGSDGIAVGGSTVTGHNYAYFEANTSESIVYINQLKFRNEDGSTSNYGWNVDGSAKNYIHTGGLIDCGDSVSSSTGHHKLRGITDTTLGSGSDERLKKNIKAIDPAKAEAFIRNLRPVSFDYRKNAGVEGKHHGLIAQEVLPELAEFEKKSTLVVKDQDGYYGIIYTELIADLISVCQTLLKRVDALEAKQ